MKISPLLLITALLCSASVLKAQSGTTPTSDPAYDQFSQQEQTFATSVGNLLALEDQAPTDGTTAIKVTAAIEANILNLLASREDYFQLFTPKAQLYIQDQVSQDAQGVSHHHYVPIAGQEKTVLGYLVCLDQQKSDDTVSGIAANAGASSYTVYNNVTATRKSLLINLEYDYLSPEVVDALYAEYYDTANQGARAQANYVWIDEKTFTGADLQHSDLPQTVFTLGLYVSLDDKSKDTGYDYGDIYDRKDDQKNYHSDSTTKVPACSSTIQQSSTPNSSIKTGRTWGGWWKQLTTFEKSSAAGTGIGITLETIGVGEAIAAGPLAPVLGIAYGVFLTGDYYAVRS